MWIYGWNFSRSWFCQKLVTFSLTLSINYSIFFNGMVKTKTFPMISLKRRVIIYVSFFHKLAVYLSICLSIFSYSGAHKVILMSPRIQKIDRQIDRHIANLWKNETYIMTLLFKLIIGNVLVLTIPLKNKE